MHDTTESDSKVCIPLSRVQSIEAFKDSAVCITPRSLIFRCVSHTRVGLQSVHSTYSVGLPGMHDTTESDSKLCIPLHSPVNKSFQRLCGVHNSADCAESDFEMCIPHQSRTPKRHTHCGVRIKKCAGLWLLLKEHQLKSFLKGEHNHYDRLP